MTSSLSVHYVQFSNGTSSNSETFLDNLSPNTAAMSSNIGMLVAFVGATLAFAVQKAQLFLHLHIHAERN